jgi:hypothetical protein
MGLAPPGLRTIPPAVGLFQRRGLPNAETSDLGSIAEIYSRNWFRRSRLIQEVALASGIVVFCGEKSTSWRELSLLADDLGFLGLLPLIKESYEGSVDTSLLRFLCPIKEGRSVPIQNLCGYARSRQTSKPIARVYALLGMSDAFIRGLIKADYSLTSPQNHWKAHITFEELFRQEPTEGHFKLIGETYLHGITDGQAFGLWWRGNKEETLLTIS